MAMSAKLKETTEKYWAKADALHASIKEARNDQGELDLLKTALFKDCPDEAAAVARVKALEKELDDLQAEVKRLEASEEIAQRSEERQAFGDRLKTQHRHAGEPPSRGGKMVLPYATLGQAVKAKWRERYQKDGRVKFSYTFGEDEETGDAESLHYYKALMERFDGFEPEVTRIARREDAAYRPIQVIQLIPMGSTSQIAIRYMQQVTPLDAAGPIAEAGAYPESAAKWESVTVYVEKIGVWQPVTDEQLEDVPFIQSVIDNQMRGDIERKFDWFILNGNGTPPQLRGILSYSGVQTVELGDNSTFEESITDAVYRGMTKVRVVGRAVPSATVMHPYNFQRVRLMRTTEGIYIWGHPSEAGPDRLWGIPVSVADVIPENTALTGDFATYAGNFLRRGVEVEVGMIDDQFVHGLQAIRAQFRVVLVVFRPSAFCKVTMLDDHVDVPTAA